MKRKMYRDRSQSFSASEPESLGDLTGTQISALQTAKKPFI